MLKVTCIGISIHRSIIYYISVQICSLLLEFAQILFFYQQSVKRGNSLIKNNKYRLKDDLPMMIPVLLSAFLSLICIPICISLYFSLNPILQEMTSPNQMVKTILTWEISALKKDSYTNMWENHSIDLKSKIKSDVKHSFKDI